MNKDFLTRWQRMTIFEQMGNIGSEVGRAISAARRDDSTAANAAISRALDLFDATENDLVKSKKSSRLREVLRARDQFLSLFFADNFADADNIEKYFMNFAIAARSNR